MGNTIVLKPATFTRLTALLLAEICHEAGLPPGTLVDLLSITPVFCFAYNSTIMIPYFKFLRTIDAKILRTWSTVLLDLFFCRIFIQRRDFFVASISSTILNNIFF